LINGDISNETPPRIIVTIDVVVQSEIQETKKALRKAETTRVVKSLNNAELSRLWNVSFKYGLSVEIVAFEDDLWTQTHLDSLMQRLDNRGGNPFNYSELFPSFHDLVSELPYRTNLKAVIDTSGQVARYGSWGLDLANL
jgi:hypothetical protein